LIHVIPFAAKMFKGYFVKQEWEEDGAKGMLNLKESALRQIIQIKPSSLIWGMPGKSLCNLMHNVNRLA